MSTTSLGGNVVCDADGLRLRGYYFPWGTKRIPYSTIRGVQRVEMSAATGRGRIWGTANPRYWANLDVTRPRKTAGLILDVGKLVKPFITPDNPATAEATIRERAKLGEGGSPTRGPII